MISAGVILFIIRTFIDIMRIFMEDCKLMKVVKVTAMVEEKMVI